jgi:hypothetical protein
MLEAHTRVSSTVWELILRSQNQWYYHIFENVRHIPSGVDLNQLPMPSGCVGGLAEGEMACMKPEANQHGDGRALTNKTVNHGWLGW